MTYPSAHAAMFPDKPAVVVAESGETLTYRELDDGSMRLAQLLHAAGLRPGDHLAVLVGNHLRFLEVYWAAMRSGLYFTPVNTYLTGSEARYVVENCQASALVVESRLDDVAAELADLPLSVRLSLDGAIPGFDDYTTAVAGYPAEPLADEPLGAHLLYSSGSTGRPKAITRELTGKHVSEGNEALRIWINQAYEVEPGTVCLSPAPLYHAAPLSFCAAISSIGGTIVLMERFDAAGALDAISRYRPSHALLVPTMFIRLLRLDDATKAAADTSSLRYVVHGASPCPASVKRGMIEWWGPVIHEYYAGSEDNGSTLIDSREWLERPGSVGTASPGCTVHVCDALGREQPAGTDGVIYFETDGAERAFEYRDEPAKTAATRHPDHPTWTTLGDVGHLDADGYLYLTDRTDYMIISGGVNISPQEIEDVLIEHPVVLDVAVFGIPDDEFGEQVKAVVQLTDPAGDPTAVAAELREFARGRLARHKVPRTVDVIEEMPRSPAGKLYKRRLRDTYLSPRSPARGTRA
ncbi:AMP-binding enzyme [Aeromicrobium marinum DSM 15272]|uniref:AMP-binding enzyme n=1 Tax=Aeromicrobium marinum DSM 15272 TaxID=585531 RepID=E2S818_9ACTN|nr:acyl-CoA synthetase [Aeromicrobium marinum]EFQ84834.1 AMP-binding enzyme [Aeromicrobium marinum DSM 15272]